MNVGVKGRVCSSRIVLAALGMLAALHRLSYVNWIWRLAQVETRVPCHQRAPEPGSSLGDSFSLRRVQVKVTRVLSSVMDAKTVPCFLKHRQMEVGIQ